jgi:septal ring factor EnvC (AmiA/AmiB activator)
MEELIRFGTQFIGYRDYAGKLEGTSFFCPSFLVEYILSLFCVAMLICLMLAEKLAEANKRADALATELEQSETARMKAEADAATVEDLQKKLDDAKKALKENVAQHAAREEEILRRLESQNRRFVSKCPHP